MNKEPVIYDNIMVLGASRTKIGVNTWFVERYAYFFSKELMAKFIYRNS